jgi:adapter protein MecA 1/2
MRIEKLNDNQIRCVLDKADLQARDIKVSELAYGSDKANLLFKEMTAQANQQFGFQVDNTPVMVEAIPLENESIALIITKVDDPEELDARFSKFSPNRNDINYENALTNKEKMNEATEILRLLNSFREALAETTGVNVPPVPSPSQKIDVGSVSPLTLVFQFDNIDNLISLSHALNTKYNGTNSLYKHNDIYYLVIEQSNHTPEEFNQICNIMCEFGCKTSFVRISPAHIVEHFELILKNDALQELSCVS